MIPSEPGRIPSLRLPRVCPPLCRRTQLTSLAASEMSAHSTAQNRTVQSVEFSTVQFSTLAQRRGTEEKHKGAAQAKGTMEVARPDSKAPAIRGCRSGGIGPGLGGHTEAHTLATLSQDPTKEKAKRVQGLSLVAVSRCPQSLRRGLSFSRRRSKTLLFSF